ncbi:MAG: FtsH protease activity modulator HflK [Deltaproteobacteria bacterium]|nr:FtsH protease activity modulator HflK [Deltaproteobacteria bacterium]
MNWDWEKLQNKRQRQGGGTPPPFQPDMNQWKDRLPNLRNFRMPGGKLLVLLLVLLWAASGIYIVEPDEVGVVQRFGAYDRTTQPGPHYHIPFPVESVKTPKVKKVQRVEIGFRSGSNTLGFFPDQVRLLPEESLMLTGDENIVDVQFIVQFKIKNPEDYLFVISNPEKSVKDVAEAAMRKVIGFNKIDAVLTAEKFAVQNMTRELMQTILDQYQSGIEIMAVQLQDVHPPREVIDAFKDVASAKEDKSRFINEAEAYSNDLLPKTRGEVAGIVNQAEGYKQSVVNNALGETSRFLAVLAEYNKAKDVTRKRLHLDTMQEIFSHQGNSKLILDQKAMDRVLPLLPLQGGFTGTPGQVKGGAQ